jgi:mono/diheme cytochrome c family protein
MLRRKPKKPFRRERFTAIEKNKNVKMNFKNKLRVVLNPLLVVGIPLTLAGCFRDTPSENPPVHVNPSMMTQPKYKPQSQSEFFANKSTMRMPVAGTVAQGELREDGVYYRGIDAQGDTIAKSPVAVTAEGLKRGQERYNIYCAPCHSQVGNGKGIMVERGYNAPPTYHSDRLRSVSDGYIYNVISNGVRNMPSYKHQIPVADRWAIVNYVRVLQRSQNATIADVPDDVKAALIK